MARKTIGPFAGIYVYMLTMKNVNKFVHPSRTFYLAPGNVLVIENKFLMVAHYGAEYASFSYLHLRWPG